MQEGFVLQFRAKALIRHVVSSKYIGLYLHDDYMILLESCGHCMCTCMDMVNFSGISAPGMVSWYFLCKRCTNCNLSLFHTTGVHTGGNMFD